MLWTGPGAAVVIRKAPPPPFAVWPAQTTAFSHKHADTDGLPGSKACPESIKRYTLWP